jgi:hypothetical protein
MALLHHEELAPGGMCPIACTTMIAENGPAHKEAFGLLDGVRLAGGRR